MRAITEGETERRGLCGGELELECEGEAGWASAVDSAGLGLGFFFFFFLSMAPPFSLRAPPVAAAQLLALELWRLPALLSPAQKLVPHRRRGLLQAL